MYQNATIQCAVCRYNMFFPENYSKSDAKSSLIPNLSLLNALDIDYSTFKDSLKSPTKEILNELYRINVSERDARIENRRIRLQNFSMRSRFRIAAEKTALVAMIILFGATTLACPFLVSFIIR